MSSSYSVSSEENQHICVLTKINLPELLSVCLQALLYLNEPPFSACCATSPLLFSHNSLLNSTALNSLMWSGIVQSLNAHNNNSKLSCISRAPD